jgi:hypothetical protein
VSNDVQAETIGRKTTPRWVTVSAIVGFVVLSLASSLLILIFDNSGSGASIQTDRYWDEITAEAAGVDDHYANVFYQITSFDAERQQAKVTTYVWPSPDIATPFSSSTITDINLSVFVDEVGGGSGGMYDYPIGSAIGGIEMNVDATNPYDLSRSIDSFYPFDQYSFTLYTQVGEINDEEELIEIPAFEESYTTAVPGFQVELTKEHDESFYSEDGRPEGFPLVQSAIEQRMSGLTMTTVIVKRSFAVQMIALLVAIFCLIIAFTLCYMTIEIVRRNRPPSMQVLVWAAANALGLISVRSLLPGAPRIGITFDILVYFPSLTATLISTVALFVLWAYREDWQI